MLRYALLLVIAAGLCVTVAIADDGQWRAGVARANITPQELMWLSGYGDRDRPAVGKRHDLWAKALVLEDPSGRRAVLVTMDLVGIDRDFSRDVCHRIETKYGFPRAAIALTVSHTHTGPVVAGNLMPMATSDERQLALIKEYTNQLDDDLLDVVGAAQEDLTPADLSWGVGTAGFAVNRRNNPESEEPRLREEGRLAGPVDHDVPVLAIRDDDGKLRAVISGYACHATVLNDYEWSGDWPGAAQIELEKSHAGALALFCAGCGADQNPLPRRTVKLMIDYGRQFADAVDTSLAGSTKAIRPSLHTSYDEVELPFAELPSRNDLEETVSRGGIAAVWAKQLLADWKREGRLSPTYPYPIQVWRLGEDLTWIFLGGEVVVDYSLRLKADLGPTIWVTAYANDVMGYIPSRRVLAEGGYEGGGARIGYGLPAIWDQQIESLLIERVHRLVEKSKRP